MSGAENPGGKFSVNSIFHEASFCHEVKSALIMLPKSLVSLYSSADVQNAHDALAVVLHVLMMETGYVPVDVIGEAQYKCLPNGWKKDNIYSIEYQHDSSVDVTCMMTCIPLGDIMCVHGTSEKFDSGCGVSISIPVYDYVNSQSNLSEPRNVYHHLAELSQIFKDTFAYTVLMHLQHAAEIQSTFGLSGLSTDFKFQILDYLPVESLVAMSAVNKEFSYLANSSFLWKNLYLRDFPDDIPPTTQGQHKWKQLYKEKYSEKKKMQELQVKERRIRGLSKCLYFPPHHSEWTPEIFHPRRDFDFWTGISPELQIAFPHFRRHHLNENLLLRHMRR